MCQGHPKAPQWTHGMVATVKWVNVNEFIGMAGTVYCQPLFSPASPILLQRRPRTFSLSTFILSFSSGWLELHLSEMMSEKKASSKNNTQHVKCMLNWMVHFWGKHSNARHEMEVVQSQREIARPSFGDVTALRSRISGGCNKKQVLSERRCTTRNEGGGIRSDCEG